MIFISGHHDCAGNKAEKGEQYQQVERCVLNLLGQYPKVKVVKLWVNDNWEVEEWR